MIIVMRKDATAAQIAEVEERVKQGGYVPHAVRGVEMTVIGVIGQRPEWMMEQIEAMPGVEETIAIEKPYKLAARELRAAPTTIRLGGAVLGGEDVVVMAGPCTVESREQLLETARGVGRLGAHVLRGGAYKPRSSPYSFQGLGEEGLRLLEEARELCGLPIITEVMEPGTVELVCEYADVLQIGARNCQNYPLLREVGQVDKPVMLKRGPGCTVEEWILAAEHIMSQGNMQVMLCERGIKTFETATRHTLDLSAVPLIKRLTHLPVVVDPSHGCGKWYLVQPMCLAAVAAGADGVLVEVHPTPDTALCDGNQSLTIENFGKCIEGIRQVAAAVGRQVPQRESVLA
ncbi:MAG TPA: 3-deoxy-7-phosphoheptulonate synthase [Chloroflexota bacterium]|jgi:3-deoxy-7-phosphoheptulonate synthase|nr:3-deoxy-7-phosphoheptulonate synthase [Chloroflexota bacterium]